MATDYELRDDVLMSFSTERITKELARRGSECHVCKKKTHYCCSDCAINFDAKVYVCQTAACIHVHELKCYGSKP